MDTANKPMVTPRELAARASLAPQTLYNRLARYRAGEPRPVNFPRVVLLGGRVRFHADDVERWLAEGDGPLEAASSVGGQP